MEAPPQEEARIDRMLNLWEDAFSNVDVAIDAAVVGDAGFRQRVRAGHERGRRGGRDRARPRHRRLPGPARVDMKGTDA
jgi:hypothetical protein